ncbi:MAG: PaaI family thioesterase [Hyphomonas sp.]
MESGEFAGWTTWAEEPFEHEAAGPFYFTIDEKGPVAAFRVAHKHMNAGGVVHGGCLMTFADFALFAIGHEAMEGEYGVTVAFTAEFLTGALEGERLEARGEVLQKGRSLSFVRGVVSTDDGRPVLNFSGTIKRRKKQP